MESVLGNSWNRVRPKCQLDVQVSRKSQLKFGAMYWSFGNFRWNFGGVPCTAAWFTSRWGLGKWIPLPFLASGAPTLEDAMRLRVEMVVEFLDFGVLRGTQPWPTRVVLFLFLFWTTVGPLTWHSPWVRLLPPYFSKWRCNPVKSEDLIVNALDYSVRLLTGLESLLRAACFFLWETLMV